MGLQAEAPMNISKHVLSLRRREDNTFPSPGVFERFGAKATWPGTVADYCRSRADHDDVLAIVAPLGAWVSNGAVRLRS